MISRNLESANGLYKYRCRFDRGNIAAESPVKYQSDHTNIATHQSTYLDSRIRRLDLLCAETSPKVSFVHLAFHNNTGVYIVTNMQYKYDSNDVTGTFDK